MLRSTSRKFVSKDCDRYIFKDGLRWAKPYWREHQITYKPKWKGQTVRRVLEQSFAHLSSSYIEHSFSNGLLYNSKGRVQENQIISPKDMLIFNQHKHEPPVIEDPVEICFENEEMMVCNKPATIPSVPSGPYHFNSVVHIVSSMLGYLPFTINRLDRLTSGVFLLGKSNSFVHKYQQITNSGRLQKLYLARVKGCFPPPIRIVNEPIGSSNAFSKNSTKKASESRFRGLDYCAESDSSLVLCQPITGRTHQLRIHLAHIEFPIVNDHLYGRVPIDGAHFRDIDYSRAPDHDFISPRCFTCSNLEVKSLWTKAAFHNGIWLHAWKYVLEDSIFLATAPAWTKCFNFSADTSFE